MRWFNERRGQRVRENPRLRLGEVRFVPASGTATRGVSTGAFLAGATQPHAEMSADTWALLQGDENIGRAYATARSRAMRQSSASTMNLIGKPTATATGSLDELESMLGGLLDAVRAISDPSEYASADLLRRRQAVLAQLLKVEDRVTICRTRLEVVDELVEARVLA